MFLEDDLDDSTIPVQRTNLSVREIPVDERPRERMFRFGAEALSEAELLALLIRTGIRGKSALELAAHMLAFEGGLAGLARREPGYLARLEGMGQAKSALLVAALEIGRRLARSRGAERIHFASSESITRYLLASGADWPQERVCALMLDSRCRLIFDREIIRGSLDSASVSPRDILRRCLLDDANSFIVYHNHPSGDPGPSRDDIVFTEKLLDSSRKIGIRLLDHVIVGREGCISMAQSGYVDFACSGPMLS